MADFTRRGFLTQMTIITGVGVAGGLGLHQVLLTPGQPRGAAPAASGEASLQPASVSLTSASLGGVSLAGPMVVHVRDVASAEISLMVGTQELIYRDPELVARLVKSAASAGATEG